HREALPVWLGVARRLNMAPAADALARLRILEHGVLPVDLVLHLEVVRVGGSPVKIQGRSNFPVFHLAPPSRRRRRQTGALRQISGRQAILAPRCARMPEAATRWPLPPGGTLLLYAKPVMVG